MLSKEENELLTRVGSGTPAGEMLRRYWWPVGFTEQVKTKDSPNRVRLLGEDLVLFVTATAGWASWAYTVRIVELPWNLAESRTLASAVVITAGSMM